MFKLFVLFLFVVGIFFIKRRYSNQEDVCQEDTHEKKLFDPSKIINPEVVRLLEEQAEKDEQRKKEKRKKKSELQKKASQALSVRAYGVRLSKYQKVHEEGLVWMDKGSWIAFMLFLLLPLVAFFLSYL